MSPDPSEMARLSGFRHIQLHAAHGYLFGLLFDRRLSPHADMVLSRMADWATVLGGQGIETSVRFSLRTGEAAFDAEGSENFYAAVAELPVDFIDVSSGFYNIDKRLIYPGRSDILARRREARARLS